MKNRFILSILLILLTISGVNASLLQINSQGSVSIKKVEHSGNTLNVLVSSSYNQDVGLMFVVNGNKESHTYYPNELLLSLSSNWYSFNYDPKITNLDNIQVSVLINGKQLKGDSYKITNQEDPVSNIGQEPQTEIEDFVPIQGQSTQDRAKYISYSGISKKKDNEQQTKLKKIYRKNIRYHLQGGFRRLV